MDGKFKDFGELYRAAYAEPESERKLLLLNEVRRAIEEWERAQGSEGPALATPLAPKPALAENQGRWARVA
jgi:hypothetical protein